MKQFLYKTVSVNENRLQNSILKVLAYFDVFKYPLRAEEIYEYCDMKGIDLESIKYELESLLSSTQIKKTGNCYFLGNESCVAEREHVNAYSEKLMRKALKYSNLISKFPFVRGISISGSLAKKSADENADVDYFIITEKNRLWICRTLLAMFKKVFLLNSRKYFCINYFIDTSNLEIPDKNVYTATEIAFLIPVFHYENFFRFLASNGWIKEYYPNKKIEVHAKADKENDIFIKKALEFLLDNKFGDILDNTCLHLNIMYRRLKFRNMDETRFKDNLRSLKGVSKHHPNSFQGKVLKAYREKMARFESYDLELS